MAVAFHASAILTFLLCCNASRITSVGYSYLDVSRLYETRRNGSEAPAEKAKARVSKQAFWAAILYLLSASGADALKFGLPPRMPASGKSGPTIKQQAEPQNLGRRALLAGGLLGVAGQLAQIKQNGQPMLPYEDKIDQKMQSVIKRYNTDAPGPLEAVEVDTLRAQETETLRAFGLKPKQVEFQKEWLNPRGTGGFIADPTTYEQIKETAALRAQETETLRAFGLKPKQVDFQEKWLNPEGTGGFFADPTTSEQIKDGTLTYDAMGGEQSLEDMDLKPLKNIIPEFRSRGQVRTSGRKAVQAQRKDKPETGEKSGRVEGLDFKSQGQVWTRKTNRPETKYEPEIGEKAGRKMDRSEMNRQLGREGLYSGPRSSKKKSPDKGRTNLPSTLISDGEESRWVRQKGSNGESDDDILQAFDQIVTHLGS